MRGGSTTFRPAMFPFLLVVVLQLHLASGSLPPNFCLQSRDGGEICPQQVDGHSAGDRRLQGSGPAPMYIHLEWAIWAGVDDVAGMMEGTLILDLAWEMGQNSFIKDPARVPYVNNFASGSGGIMTTEEFPIHQPNATSWVFTRVTYVGRFKQQTYSTECYPFDEGLFEFDVEIKAPSSWVFRAELWCQEGEEGVYTDGTPVNATIDLEKTVQLCTKRFEDDKIASGFYWESVTCERQNAFLFTCRFKARRVYSKVLLLYFYPALLLIVMGIFSFRIPPHLSMPRVATTMIAMLNMNNLKGQLASTLPKTGEPSWLEDFFQASMTLMLLNLLGHVYAFKKYTEKQIFQVEVLDHLSVLISFAVLSMFVTTSLLSKNCVEQQAHGPTIYGFLFASIAVICMGLAWTFWKYYDVIIGWYNNLNNGVTEDLPEDECVVEALQMFEHALVAAERERQRRNAGRLSHRSSHRSSSRSSASAVDKSVSNRVDTTMSIEKVNATQPIVICDDKAPTEHFDCREKTCSTVGTGHL